MKKMLILLAAITIVMNCNAQKDIPATVKSTFQKQYPDIKKVKWEKEQNNYEASFETNEINHSVLIDASGKIVETEVEINLEALPTSVKDYVAKNYAGNKIKEAAKITDANGAVTYEAEVKGKDLLFDSNGVFIKESK